MFSVEGIPLLGPVWVLQLLGLRFPLLLTLPLAGGVARDPGGDPRSSSHVSQVGAGRRAAWA